MGHSGRTSSQQAPTAFAFIDFETRSRVDLASCGVSKYAADPSTEILCMAYSIGGTVRVWRPGEPFPAALASVREIWGHNVSFESEIWRHIAVPRHGFPRIADNRWHCTAAQAGYAGLPQSLAKLSERLELGDAAKDKEGHANMLTLCRPFKRKSPKVKKGEPKPPPDKVELIDGIWHGGEFNNDPEKHEKNAEYCRRDVVAEITAHRRLPPLPERERRTWLTHRRINRRGVPVDLDLCRGAVAIIEQVSARYLAEIAEITDGKITTADQRQRILDFCAERGCPLPNLQEGTVAELLPTIQDEKAHRVLEIRQLLQSAAVKKYQAVINAAGDDWRCRDGFVYYAAGPGRWGGYGPQFQNLKRPQFEADVIAEAVQAILNADVREIERLSNGDPFTLLASCVRSIIKAPPGRKLVISDFTGIEARKLAWLAGAETMLDLFRTGADPYVKMACDILGCTPQDIFVHTPDGKIARDESGKKIYAEGGEERRQLGKIPFLGAGYQMGWSHLKEVGKKQAGVDLTDDMAQTVVETFRNNNPEIPQFWRDIEGAAKWCFKNRKPVHHPGGKFRFRTWGEWLIMRIPCGRELFYFRPRLEHDGRFEQLVYESPRGPKQLYGGLLTENITQASSRDLLVDAMHRAEAINLEIFMHCHDEICVEADADDDAAAAWLTRCMEQVAPWADGCPVTAETTEGERYAK